MIAGVREARRRWAERRVERLRSSIAEDIHSTQPSCDAFVAGILAFRAAGDEESLERTELVRQGIAYARNLRGSRLRKLRRLQRAMITAGYEAERVEGMRRLEQKFRRII